MAFHARQTQWSSSHNPKKIRRAILNRLMEELGEGPTPIFYAQRAVRDATAQDLRER
jgi:hypothetical protein